MPITASLALAVLWMGIYPESFLAPMRNDVGAVLARLAPTAPEGDAKVVVGPVKTTVSAHAEAHH